jgi:hypothetical protein
VFVLKDDEDADGNKVQRKIMIVPYDLFPVDILTSNKEHTIHMMALRPDGAQTVTLSQKAVVSKDETLKSLANQNVMASFGSLNDNNLFQYIRASVEKMSMEKAPVRVPESYGWQKGRHLCVCWADLFHRQARSRTYGWAGEHRQQHPADR